MMFAVELKQTLTFSTYIEASSERDAAQEVKRRAALMEPDSIVFDAIAYKQDLCKQCGEIHFGPTCQVRKEMLRPSWERARL
jgi:hypothetical protein